MLPVLTATTEWITAAAAIVVAVIAVIGIIGLIVQRQRQRLELGPFLRIDVGPNHSAYLWEPPQAHRVLEDRGFSHAKPDEANHDLWAWIENRQTTSLGHATRINVSIEISHPDPEGKHVQDLLVLDASYVEPRQTVAIKILKFTASWDSLLARVISVTYRDVWGHRQSGFYGRQYCKYQSGDFVPYPGFDWVGASRLARMIQWIDEKI